MLNQQANQVPVQEIPQASEVSPVVVHLPETVEEVQNTPVVVAGSLPTKEVKDHLPPRGTPRTTIISVELDTGAVVEVGVNDGYLESANLMLDVGALDSNNINSSIEMLNKVTNNGLPDVLAKFEETYNRYMSQEELVDLLGKSIEARSSQLSELRTPKTYS